MSSTRSRYASCTASSWSSTGPQYRLWHRAGVANMTATGLPEVSARSSDTVCSGHAGSRVHNGSTPCVAVTVGVGVASAFAPTTGTFGVDVTCQYNGAGGCPATCTTPPQIPAAG